MLAWTGPVCDVMVCLAYCRIIAVCMCTCGQVHEGAVRRYASSRAALDPIAGIPVWSLNELSLALWEFFS